MGQSKPKSAEAELEGYTKVDGIAIAAQIARAMPPAQRERILAQMANQSPLVAAQVQAKIASIELEIASARVAQSKRAGQPMVTRNNIPAAPFQSQSEQVASKPSSKASPKNETQVTELPELSPAELLLRAREGSVEELERELEKQQAPGTGRRKITSA